MKNYKGVIDSTLREGQQYRFATFSTLQQKRIVKLLAQVGVDRIEVGNPVAQEVRNTIKNLIQIGKRPPILAHVRNRLEDINTAKKLSIDGVNILCTIDPQRISKMKLTFDKYLRNLRQSILSAKEKDLEIRVSVEDYFQLDERMAMQVYQLAERLEVNRIGIADTLGVAMSWVIEEKIKTLRKMFATDIEVHFHNDLGQANSNALTALRSGANWVDTTLLGIGERSGITALSTFLASLYLFDESIADRYRLDLVTDIENAVAGMIGRDVPFNLLTNRDNGFAHKAGIHLHALMNFGPNTYEPFSPKVIGNIRQIIYGTPISGGTSRDEVITFREKHKR